MKLLLFTLFCAASVWSCGGAKKAGAESEPATPVQVVEAVEEPIQRIVTADAILYPVAQSAITPKIGAPVRRFLVNRGDHVRAGQLLVELEDRDLIAALSESKALLAQSKAQFLTTTQGTLPEDMTKARTDVQTAEQTVDAAQTLYNNRVMLVKEGALAQKLADDAKVSLVTAQSQLDTARRHLESLNQVSRGEQIKGAGSAVDAAQARVASSQAQVDYAQVRSPIAGIVADRPVSPGEMAASGSALLTIVDISEIVARANVPVREVSALKVGDDATITAPEGELKGKITVVSPAVDPSSTTVEVWVRARNPGERMKPGVTCKVSIDAGTIPRAIVIPAAALLSSDEGDTEVMVVDSDSTAHERKVKTGVRDGDNVQIVSGLKAGEAVVVSGGIGLADKAKVEGQSADKHE